jgi:hydrogenase maturation factor
MKVGKLPAELLASLLARIPNDPSVLLGPGIGRDAAAVDLGDGRVLVAKTDPVTFATEEIGRYAVHVNANDVACLGARPRWFLASVLLPENAPPATAAAIFEQILDACAQIGVSPVGGHMEITLGLDRPVVVGAMIGETTSDRLIRPEGAHAGDHIVLTKGIAIEGTALLAREAPEALSRGGCPSATIQAAGHLLVAPGISVLREAFAACDAARVHALHDPTEGGLATALLELGQPSGLRVRVRRDDVRVLPETHAVCEALGLEPLGLLASGALLAVVAPEDCDAVRNAIEHVGVQASCIGDMVAQGGDVIMDNRGERPLPGYDRDELARFLEAST